MLAELVFVRGEENPDPHAARKEYGMLFFSMGKDSVIRSNHPIPGGT